MKKPALALLVATLLTSGCTRRLMIQPNENPALSAGKIAVRVPLAVLSLGFSEMMADCVRETARETGLPTTPNSPVWDICNGRGDIAGYRAGLATGAHGMAAAGERERERALQERAVRALELDAIRQSAPTGRNCTVTCRPWGVDQVRCKEICY